VSDESAEEILEKMPEKKKGVHTTIQAPVPHQRVRN
jgi:hypothetical protein